jgi:transcriptional regulator with XRE-family HTH domain
MSNTLADRLKIAMEGPPRVTGRALANACGIKAPSVSDWIKGKSKTMTGPNLLAAAEFLRVRPKWLAEGLGPMRDDAHALASPTQAAQPSVTYLPEMKADALTQELLDLFAQLDTASKREWLANLRGFVAGRGPHPHGAAPAMAGK